MRVGGSHGSLVRIHFLTLFRNEFHINPLPSKPSRSRPPIPPCHNLTPSITAISPIPSTGAVTRHPWMPTSSRSCSDCPVRAAPLHLPSKGRVRMMRRRLGLIPYEGKPDG